MRRDELDLNQRGFGRCPVRAPRTGTRIPCRSPISRSTSSKRRMADAGNSPFVFPSGDGPLPAAWRCATTIAARAAALRTRALVRARSAAHGADRHGRAGRGADRAGARRQPPHHDQGGHHAGGLLQVRVRRREAPSARPLGRPPAGHCRVRRCGGRAASAAAMRASAGRPKGTVKAFQHRPGSVPDRPDRRAADQQSRT